MSAGTVDLVRPLLDKLPAEFTVDDLVALLPSDVRRRQIAAALTVLVRAGSLVAVEDPDVARGRALRRWQNSGAASVTARAEDATVESSQQTPPESVLLRSDGESAPIDPPNADVAAASNVAGDEQPFAAGPLLTRNAMPVPSRRRPRR